MAAIRMEGDNSITVLVDPWIKKMFGEIAQGVYLTRSYENATGILPEEHIFISKNESWFYWLGYYKDLNSIVPDTPETNDELEIVTNYINEYSIENQIQEYSRKLCEKCNKKETMYCEMQCPNGLF